MNREESNELQMVICKQLINLLLCIYKDNYVMKLQLYRLTEQKNTLPYFNLYGGEIDKS